MSLTMDFSITLDAFATPLSLYVEDREGTYDSPERPGEWVWFPVVQRPAPIKTIVLALSLQQMALYKEGNVTEGGIALLTQEQLYYTNITTPYTEQNKQSFVLYQRMRFRVVGDGFISDYNSIVGNGNFHCYHALRYLE